MMARIPGDQNVDLKRAAELFTDREARDSLVREAGEEHARPSVGLSDLKDAVRTGAPMNTLGDGNVIPFRAVQLYRAMLTRRSIGVSQMARAARTADDMRRTIGDFELNIVRDEDIIFVMLSPVDEIVPKRLTLLNDDGRTLSLDLPAPVNAAQQLGLATNEAETQLLLALLEDPATSLFIS